MHPYKRISTYRQIQQNIRDLANSKYKHQSYYNPTTWFETVCWACNIVVQTGWIPGPDPPLFILESRVLWWPLYYDVTSCSADGNFEVTLATKATLMASGKGALNKLRLPTFITITMPLPQKFSLQNCAIKLGHLLVGKRTTSAKWFSY